MHRRLAALLFAALGTPSALAQTSSDTATIQALLVEVRHLRLALERSAVTGPKIQLTFQRLQLQQAVVSRLLQQLEDLRDQIARSSTDDARAMVQIKSAETHIAQEQDAVRRKALEEEMKVLRARREQEGEQQKLQDAQQRTRESELAGRLQTEQAKWNELNDRLNDLERLLDAPPKLHPSEPRP